MQTLGMDSSLGSPEQLMEQLQDIRLTESQGAFMKKNVFQEEMKLLNQSLSEGHLPKDILEALKNEDNEADRLSRSGSENTIHREPSLDPGRMIQPLPSGS